MKNTFILLAALALHASAGAGALVQYEQSYEGHIELHNQVQYHTIPIYAGNGDLRVWTDFIAAAPISTPSSRCGATVCGSPSTTTTRPSTPATRAIAMRGWCSSSYREVVTS